MITEIGISNFRSIKEQTIPIKKLNILYGPNGSGKSSVAYASYVMRNFFVNPNQKLNSLFNLGFINLGGYENISRVTKNYSTVDIKLTSKIKILPKDKNLISYSLKLLKNSNVIIKYALDINKDEIAMDIPTTSLEKKEVTIEGFKFLWNGLAFESIKKNNDGNKILFTDRRINAIFSDIKSIEVISVKRGFFSPIFSSEADTDESKLAMQIRNEGLDFEFKIDKYFYPVFGKNFRFVAVPGNSSFYLRTDNKSGKTIDLVNEGFGINQFVYMLIKLLKKETGLAFIEEPEIHLHPSAQGKMVDVFVDIINKEDKQIFLTTHSENIVTAALSKIAVGELSIDDVQFLLAEIKDGETIITPQTVNEKGQLEGGLMSFMENELDNLKKFLGV